MADGDVAEECAQRRLVKDLGDETEFFDDGHPFTVGDRNAGAFLATMLECIQPEVRQPGRIGAGRPDSKHPARFTGAIEEDGFGQRTFQHCAQCRRTQLRDPPTRSCGSRAR